MALPIWGIWMKKCIADGTLGLSPEDRFKAPANFAISLDCGEDMTDAATGVSSGQAGEDEENYFD